MDSSNKPSNARGSILEKAEAHTRRGEFAEAMHLLGHADTEPSAEYPEYWMGIVCIASARNKLHMQDDPGARALLELIPASLRKANPKIDAECQTVVGILQRREAYRLWKSGHTTEAVQQVEEAMRAFSRAEESAQIALEVRLRHNAVLNRLYAQGLLCALQKQSRDHYLSLLTEAMLAEVKSRESTPPHIKDDLSGLIMIADLARGAEIELEQVAFISDKTDFVLACKMINPGRHLLWSALILHQVRESHCSRPDAIGRALLLGKKMLDASKKEPGNLLIEYASQLRICYLNLKSMRSHEWLVRAVEDTLNLFPEDIAKRIISPTFFR